MIVGITIWLVIGELGYGSGGPSHNLKISTPFLNIGLNTFYQALSRATIATAALIITRLLVTKLGIEGYGRYQVVVIYASLFWFFSDFGLNTLVVREASANPRRIQEFFSTLFSLRSLLGLILIIIAFLSRSKLNLQNS